MCDAASSWVEFAQLEGNYSYKAAIHFDCHWLCQYPRSKACIFDNRPEFKAEFLEMLQSYGIKKLPTMVKNPRANLVVERVHLTLAEMFRVTIFQGQHWRREVDRILQSTAWAMQSMINTTTKYSPGQMIFGLDMIMHANAKTCWDSIHEARKKLTEDSSKKENKKRIEHTYSVNDLVLILPTPGKLRAKLRRPTKGLYKIVKVYKNETVKIQQRSNTKMINIHQLKLYNEQTVAVMQPQRNHLQPGRR
eukprot:9453027-Ditylum_brightwellii.AAC.2